MATSHGHVVANLSQRADSSVRRPTFECVLIGTLEPWQQQEEDKVYQRQEVVAKQAGCKKEKQKQALLKDCSTQMRFYLITNRHELSQKHGLFLRRLASPTTLVIYGYDTPKQQRWQEKPPF